MFLLCFSFSQNVYLQFLGLIRLRARFVIRTRCKESKDATTVERAIINLSQAFLLPDFLFVVALMDGLHRRVILLLRSGDCVTLQTPPTCRLRVRQAASSATLAILRVKTVA
jgi:hypothetical protein